MKKFIKNADWIVLLVSLGLFIIGCFALYSATQTTELYKEIANTWNIILDFPGLNAAEEIVKHLKVQKSTLSMIPARMICLVIKLSVRYDDMVKSAIQMVKIFYENKDNITIIITNCEDITIKQQAEIETTLSKK